ncbi:uncharacterized protein LOC113276035 [Papaver somniferum]|uniref:uncharacterized protein LOC113276035 n=1 Tax=Papaver somniferum TaxID=3469 RepID=UPI000E6FAB6D|nr:uncharacterized protein LOC113276035 [Papaver somniferum]
MAGSVVSEVNDGPVLNLMNKRLRALRKKYNRIIQMEEAVSQGKSLNKEQEEVLRSKPSVVILIDEYEKLRQPLSIAVQEEHNQNQNQTSRSDDSAVEDLVRFLYLGNSFDAKEQSEFTAMMLTKTHERGCCISYDYVTDDASNDLLGEKDLDMIARLSSLLISKPVDSGCLSHEKAIENCISRAKLWLSSSEEPIEPGTAVTYSELRKRVSKILGSDYLTTTPEMKDPVEVVAAATAGNYTVPEMKAPVEVVAAATAGSYTVPEEHSSVPLETERPISRELVFMVNHEKYGPVATQEQVTGDGHSHPVEELAKDESELLNQVDATSAQQEENKQEDVIDQNPEEEGWQEQHSRRNYQNQRGGGRGGVGGRRGSNGRGGRGNRGGGGFHNGRGQNGEQPGNYNSRNYNNSRGRGGRGAGGHGYSNNHASADHVRSAQAGVDR